MSSAGPIPDTVSAEEIPRCDCGRNEWSVEYSTNGRDREIRILRCGACDQLGVVTGYHTRSLIDFSGSVEL